MKKALIIVGIVLVVIIAALAIIPVVFKDDIRKEVDSQLASSVNADVYFDDFGVTLFRNFPGLTVYMTDFGITGRDEFEGLPLVAMESFELEINLLSLVFGDQIKINGIMLASPQVYVKVLEDGTANYDIAVASEDTLSNDAEESGSAFSVGIDHWEIKDGKLIYDDELYKVFTKLIGLNHTGSGDFNQDVFDLRTTTMADTMTLAYEGAKYISDKNVGINFTINISEDYSKYIFRENSIRINDFVFGFDGSVKLLEEGYDLDLTYVTQDNSFSSLLSLIPSEMLTDLSEIETSGNLAFEGFLKGIYAENKMPGFNVHMQVKDGRVKYPDLPTAVEAINFDVSLDHAEGESDPMMTRMDLKSLSMDMGGNPISANVKVEDFIHFPIDGNLNAKLNLADLTSMMPIEGLEMKGIFNIDASAKGKYDSLAGIFPALDISMSLENGFVKSVDFPIPVEKLNVKAEVKNETGLMKDLLINIPDMSMVMGEDKLNAKAVIQNMDDYAWEVNVHGGLDLNNIMKIYPIENTRLSGKIKADIDTKGKMSDLDAGSYDKMPTSGSVAVSSLSYESPDLPQGMTISNAAMTVTPERINISSYNGTLGKSDVAIKGAVTNYMGYVLKDEILKGTMSFNSKEFNVNEWMIEEEGAEETVEVAEEGEVVAVEIPKNIDFVLNSGIATLLYDNLTLKNMKGTILLKNGIMTMKGVNFSTLGGEFAMDGTYDSRDLDHPTYDFDMNIKELSFGQSYSAFNTVKAFAPIAKLVDGAFSSKFNVNGELKQDMTPNLNTLNLDGLFEIAQAALIKSDILTGLTNISSLDASKADKLTLKDVIMKTSIENGRIKVDPFKLKLGDYDAQLGGSYGLDNKLDYVMTVDVPAGELGNQLNSALASLTGSENNVSDIIKLPINIGGSYTKPLFKLGAAEATKTVTDQAKSAVKEKANEEIEEAKKKAEEELKKKAKDKLKKLFKGN